MDQNCVMALGACYSEAVIVGVGCYPGRFEPEDLQSVVSIASSYLSQYSIVSIASRYLLVGVGRYPGRFEPKGGSLL